MPRTPAMPARLQVPSSPLDRFPDVGPEALKPSRWRAIRDGLLAALAQANRDVRVSKATRDQRARENARVRARSLTLALGYLRGQSYARLAPGTARPVGHVYRTLLPHVAHALGVDSTFSGAFPARVRAWVSPPREAAPPSPTLQG